MKKFIALILSLTFVLALVGCGNGEKIHTIEITIPAGSTEVYVFSDQEISPKSSITTISVDTKVDLKLSQVREENSYELMASLAQESSIELPLAKGTWYKIGVGIQEPVDNDITVSIELENVEISIE